MVLIGSRAAKLKHSTQKSVSVPGTRTACQIEPSYLAPGPRSQSWKSTVPGHPVLLSSTSALVILVPAAVEQLRLSQFSGWFFFFKLAHLCKIRHVAYTPHMMEPLIPLFTRLLCCSADAAAMFVVSVCRIITCWCKSVSGCLFSCLNKASAWRCCLLFISNIRNSFRPSQLLERHMLCVSVYSRLLEFYLSKTDVTFTPIAEWLKQKRSEAE